jgi:hypothetical protein
MICWQAPMSFTLKTAGLSILLILFFSLPFKPALGKVIDQILAVVNGHLITQSDLRIQTRFSLEFPLLEEKEKDNHLQFAIDQVLLLEDAEKFATEKPGGDEINEVFKKAESAAGSEEKLALLLSIEGIGKNELRELISRYLLSKKFVDQRINYFIFIPDNEIESYYNDHLADGNGSTLEMARTRIYSVLFEQKRKTKLEEYLIKRRSKASIQINPPYSVTPQ